MNARKTVSDEHHKPRLYILDTNVLMHDPASLFRFQEHDILLPMIVLEELDQHKKGLSEQARNVRQVSRRLDELLTDTADLDQGLPLPYAQGRLFFQTAAYQQALPEDLAGGKADNEILAVTLALQNRHPEKDVILVSKDINLRKSVPFIVVFAFVIGVALIFSYPPGVLFSLFLVYALSGYVLWVWRRIRRWRTRSARRERPTPPDAG